MQVASIKLMSLCLSSYNAKSNGSIAKKKGTVEKIISTGKIPRGMLPFVRVTNEDLEELRTVDGEFL